MEVAGRCLGRKGMQYWDEFYWTVVSISLGHIHPLFRSVLEKHTCTSNIFNPLYRKCFRWLSCTLLYTSFLLFWRLGPGGNLRYCMEILGPGIYRQLLFEGAPLGRWVPEQIQGLCPLLLPFPLPGLPILALPLTWLHGHKNWPGNHTVVPSICLVEPDFLWESELHFFNGFS